MNYNANFGGPPTGATRKVKRVSDVNAMGPPVPAPQPFVPVPYSGDASYGIPAGPQIDASVPVNFNAVPAQPQPRNVTFNAGVAPAYDPYNVPTSNPQFQQQGQFQSSINTGPMPPAPGIGGQFAMFQQPMVQDMALQYGQKLADHGKQLVESQFEKYIPVTRLKYYFAVDNNYVINKLRLLFFPFTHRDWSLKYDHDNPVQPRYDLNAPDLYIPTMAYITYVVLAGLVLGMQNQFSPEQLGILSSSALAYSLFELMIYSITLYVSNISTSLKTLDLLAFAGYKFAIIVLCILVSIVFKRVGYYSALIYSSVTFCFFLLRTLKAKILHDNQSSNTAATYDAYGNVQQPASHDDYSVGRKRKLYFLFLIAGLQPVLSFWLSMHLISNKVVEAS